MKTTREHLNIIDAYHQLGSYRAAALACGTTDKTVKRAVERHQAGGPWVRRPRPLTKNTDAVMAVVAKKVEASDGRISAKRLVPVARAAGYTGCLTQVIKQAREQRRQQAEDSTPPE